MSARVEQEAALADVPQPAVAPGRGVAATESQRALERVSPGLPSFPRIAHAHFRSRTLPLTEECSDEEWARKSRAGGRGAIPRAGESSRKCQVPRAWCLVRCWVPSAVLG